MPKNKRGTKNRKRECMGIGKENRHSKFSADSGRREDDSLFRVMIGGVSGDFRYDSVGDLQRRITRRQSS